MVAWVGCASNLEVAGYHPPSCDLQQHRKILALKFQNTVTSQSDFVKLDSIALTQFDRLSWHLHGNTSTCRNPGVQRCRRSRDDGKTRPRWQRSRRSRRSQTKGRRRWQATFREEAPHQEREACRLRRPFPKSLRYTWLVDWPKQPRQYWVSRPHQISTCSFSRARTSCIPIYTFSSH